MTNQQQKLTCVSLLVLVCAVSLAAAVPGFPSLFGRQRLFGGQRNPAQAIPLEQQQSASNNNNAQNEQHLMQLAVAANSIHPVESFDHFGLRQAAISPTSLHRQQHRQLPQMQHQSLDQAVHYFKPIASLEGPLMPLPALVHPMASFDSSVEPSSPGVPLTSGSRLHSGSLEPSPSGEIVDKIERHVGQQIEQSLGGGGDSSSSGSSSEAQSAGAGEGGSGHAAAADGQADQRAASEYRRQEKESSSASGGGGDSESEPTLESKKSHHHEHHAEHHEEHPPEAFEVHHKKGGKSFQYFHQGHHH